MPIALGVLRMLCESSLVQQAQSALDFVVIAGKFEGKQTIECTNLMKRKHFDVSQTTSP